MHDSPLGMRHTTTFIKLPTHKPNKAAVSAKCDVIDASDFFAVAYAVTNPMVQIAPGGVEQALQKSSELIYRLQQSQPLKVRGHRSALNNANTSAWQYEAFSLIVQGDSATSRHRIAQKRHRWQRMELSPLKPS